MNKTDYAKRIAAGVENAASALEQSAKLSESLADLILDPYGINRAVRETRAKVRDHNQKVARSLGLDGWSSGVGEQPIARSLDARALWMIVGGTAVLGYAFLVALRPRKRFVIPPGYHAWHLPKFEGSL